MKYREMARHGGIGVQARAHGGHAKVKGDIQMLGARKL